ncbi:tetratricopeptide repeat protein [Aquimarina rubra]|uniref:Tetratricopeptide repeat protein n=1 Tax=Aquimarina rubra TaxID=1920033 RepID=A0ABW5LKC5_9FLAO
MQSQTSFSLSDSDAMIKIKELQNIAEVTYRKGDFELYKKYVDSLQVIAKDYGFLEDEILAVVGQGIYYSNLNIYNESLEKYLKALDRTEELPENSKTKIIVLVNLGNLYNNLSQYDRASETFKKVIRLAKQHENPERVLIASYNALGITAGHQNKHEESLLYAEKVDSFATALARNDIKIVALNNIADSYIKLEKYQKALQRAEQALDLITKEESVESKANSHLHLGVAYLGLNEPINAIDNLLIVKDISASNSFLKLKMQSHKYLAKAYELNGNLKKSLNEHKQYVEVKDAYLNSLSEGKRIIAERELKEQEIFFTEEKDLLESRNKKIILFGSLLITFVVLGLLVYFFNRRKALRKQSESLALDKELLENENRSLKDKLNEIMRREPVQEPTISLSNSSNKYQNSSLSYQDRDEYAERILKYMEDEKPYLNEDLKQSDFAEALDMSVPQVSEVLNACFRKNFNNFLNLYRINEVKKLMKNPSYEEYKIVAIGYEAGFKSKTSFNRAFKNLVGVTPSEYRKKSA